jgi:hypothetical protein
MYRILLAAFLSVSAMAQTVTSPTGLGATEGNSTSASPWSLPSLRFQQIDATLRSLGPRAIGAVSFRRDGEPFVRHAAGARRVNVSLTLAHGSLANASTNFAANLQNATEVLTRVDFDLPKLSGRSPTVPGPWDATLALPNAWPYGSQLDFAWELLVHSNTGTDQSAVDFADATFTSGTFEIKVPGCSGPFGEPRTWSRFDNLGPQQPMRWLAGVYGGAANAPAGVLVGIGPAQIILPKPPCDPFPSGPQRFYPDPLFELPLGATGANGDASTTLSFAHSPGLLGVRLHLQGYAFDQGFFWNVQLASGGDVVVPVNPGGVRTRALLAPSAVAQTATQVLDGGIVVGLR